MRITKNKAIKYLRQFSAIDDEVCNYPETSETVKLLKRACTRIDRLSDRFNLNINDYLPLKVKSYSKNEQLRKLIKSFDASLDKNGVAY